MGRGKTWAGVRCGDTFFVLCTLANTYTPLFAPYTHTPHPCVCTTHPGTYEDRAVPTRIKALVGKDIERVAGGTHHTLFLRRDGVVYGCGSCKLGQVSEAGWCGVVGGCA